MAGIIVLSRGVTKYILPSVVEYNQLKLKNYAMQNKWLFHNGSVREPDRQGLTTEANSIKQFNMYKSCNTNNNTVTNYY